MMAITSWQAHASQEGCSSVPSTAGCDSESASGEQTRWGRWCLFWFWSLEPPFEVEEACCNSPWCSADTTASPGQ